MPRSASAAPAFGVPGVRIAVGDHLCAFYRGIAERDEILVPYLREGIRSGDKCICVVDATEPEAVLAALVTDAEPTVALGGGSLDVRRSRDTYLRGGRFSAEAMLGFWDGAVGEAMASGFGFTRAVGEMTWSLRDLPGVEQLVGYESELNRFLPRYPQVILCLYDLEAFSGQILMDVLKTHPKVLVGGMLVVNPYYLDPDEFLADRP